MQISNIHDIPLVAAVWAASDDYDHIYEPNYISATTLLKPTQEIVLRKRLTTSTVNMVDVADLLPSALGTSIHTAVENAWKNNYKATLKALGYDDATIELVLINPSKEEVKPNSIPIYLEQRSIKSINGFSVGGKYDIVMEGRLHDVKSTSVYSWIYGSKVDDYKLQGSIYRWLNPEIITGDSITIVYVFTDWSKAGAKSNPKYPPKRVEEISIPLMSIADTEKFIFDKLEEIKQQSLLENHELKPCNNQELWMKEPTFKYYADINKTSGRSTKNFTSEIEANTHMNTKGRGVVIKSDPLPTRCNYCAVSNICLQRAAMLSNLEWESDNDSIL